MEENKWKPGQSGNPAGKKPGTLNFKTVLNSLLDEDVEVSGGKRIPQKVFMMMRLIQMARGYDVRDDKGKVLRTVDPDLKAILSVMDRVDGKPDQKLNVGGDPNNPISTKVTFEIANQLKKFIDSEDQPEPTNGE